MHWIFSGLFIVSFLIGLIRFFLGEHLIFSEMLNSMWNYAEAGIGLCIFYAGIITLFQGLMNIGQSAGLIQKLAKLMQPFFRKIFPEIPENHPALGSIMLNISANMLNLGNAATPFGLKAMEEMEEINKEKGTASNAQIMFLVLNTSGLTLIPVAIMALRSKYGSMNAGEIFIPVLLTTFCSTLGGLILTAKGQKINLFNGTVFRYLSIIVLLMSTLICIPLLLNEYWSEVFLGTIGGFILITVLVGFMIAAIKKKINIYESFIDGAKSGVNTAFKIAPYLIGIIVVIGLFKTSGALNLLQSGIEMAFSSMDIDTDFIKAIPVALMRPLSGTGAEAMAITVFETHGIDSFAGKLASLFQGSSETTLYVMAVYFGSVGIRNTRNAVFYGLSADLIGAISAIFIAYIYFG